MVTDIDGFEDLSEGLSEFRDKVDEASRRVDETLDDATAETAEEVADKASRILVEVHNAKRTGRLSNNIGHARVEQAHFEVGTSVDYAKFVERGTDPHVIVPKNKEALRFERERSYFGIADEEIFTQYAQHPGTTRQPFLQPALVTSRDTFRENIVDHMERMLREELL